MKSAHGVPQSVGIIHRPRQNEKLPDRGWVLENKAE